MSSLSGLGKNRKYDLEEFMKRIKKFEGTIFDGKILGEANVLFSNGEIYKGHFDEKFMKTGYGLNLTSGKSVQLYSGNFKNNLYHGFGKVFKNRDEFTLGYYEEGKMLMQFDIDNMDTNLYE